MPEQEQGKPQHACARIHLIHSHHNISTTTFVRIKKTLLKVGQAFPGALSNKELLERVGFRLSRRGFQQDTTLVASSLCSDEVNRPLEDTFLKYYGNHFAMGGLAGFPFSGVTGFGVSCFLAGCL
jgi:hypothetical protein